MVKGIAVLVGLVVSAVLATALAILAPAIAAEDGPQLEATARPIPYKGVLEIWGHRIEASDTIGVETPGGRALSCESEVQPSELPYFECNVDGLFTEPGQAGTTSTLFVKEFSSERALVGSVEITITFEHSRFRRSDAPPYIAGSDRIVVEGETEEDPNLSIVWTLEKDGELLAEDGCLDWYDDFTEAFYFRCEFTDAGLAAGVASNAWRGRSAVRSAAAVLPAVIPSGSYTAKVDEYRNASELLDTIVYTFDVGQVAAPPPEGPPTTDLPSDPRAPTFDALPLAPIVEPQVITDDAPPPDDQQAAPTPNVQTPPLQDDEILRTLLLIVTAMTLLTLIGPRGLAHPRRLAGAATTPTGAHTAVGSFASVAALGGGEPADADADAGRARPFGNAWGDRSITWRIPGWTRIDAAAAAVPAALSGRVPLVARGLGDATYLRAAFGVGWLALPVAAVVLGAAAAGGASGLVPSWILAAILVAIAAFDATAGLAAVTTFALITALTGGLTAGELTLSQGVRGLLGLAALWFVTPLIAAAARPVRRPREPGKVYPWDRLGDTVIAALISGWAVQGIVGGLSDLMGQDLAISERADSLALTAIGAVMARFLLEELVSDGYPRRLALADLTDRMREPSTFHAVRGVLIRAGLLAFFAGALIGSCWQLWVGIAIFSIPQVLGIVELPASDGLAALGRVVPRGVLLVLVLVLVGTAISYAIDAGTGDVRLDSLRTGFVLLAMPGALLELLAFLGGTPTEPRWTWPRQLAGAVVVGATIAAVLAFG